MQIPRRKRKRSCKDASGPPAKKILGDGTRHPSTPITWKSSSSGIVIKLVNVWLGWIIFSGDDSDYFTRNVFIWLVNLLQWSHHGDHTLSSDWTTVPFCPGCNFGSRYRLWCKDFSVLNMKTTQSLICNVSAFHTEDFVFLSLKEMNKSQQSSLWWPEHCKDKSKMTLHQQQADIFHTLRGLLLLFSQRELLLSPVNDSLHFFLIARFLIIRYLFICRAPLRHSAGSDCRWSQSDFTNKEG